ncbi:amidase [Sporothrix schenckii 1099-18]|uniref:Amidase domain-containing protein n=2 Tax=Sporothrix schenckii TaxID=29908 RepID=U7PML4_SPOS1|nr:amidase [Sporothrix schenckii 1099-18]ERS96176.1 hypothetical protein HMPREF1624_07712 [Sporothrix schenckii ATCC 58251]KJR79796.1 amidase [Sporothrix schenckii 1099-18]
MLPTAADIKPHYQQRIKHALSILEQSLPRDSILPELPAVDTLDVTDVPRTCGLLTDWEIEVTERYDATALVDLLATRKITAVALLHAFRKRASIAHQLTNCLTELLPEAITAAEAADAHIAETGKPLGPLHGLPVSLKEQIAVSGHATHAAFVAWIDNETQRDAHLTASLKAMGAIVFSRTAQPQSFMHLETSNNIYGATVHARDRTRTAGGSSGGETALLSMHATPLGFGGDIGGSIRAPSSLNGVWGFKPSVGRVSGSGVVVPSPGCDSIHGTLGAFTRSLRDLNLFHGAYSATKPWIDDPSLLPYAVSVESSTPLRQPLRIGIMNTDDVVTPLPPVQVVLEKVVTKLRTSPLVEVVPFKPLDHDVAWKVITANYWEDGGAKIRELCAESGEGLRPLTQWMMDECRANEAALGSTTQDRRAARDAFRARYSEHWSAANVDVVIAPVTTSTAPPLDTSRYWGYTAIWNLVDYPALAFPASDMVGGYGEDLSARVYEPRNDTEVYLFEHYNPQDSQNMPVGLQIVTRKWMDSECLAAAEIIEKLLVGSS